MLQPSPSLPCADDAVAAPLAEDPVSQATVDLARRVAGTDVTVMLTGESGAGKEVFARFIHRASARRGGPFVAVNCAAIPEPMLEALLFGHEKGAFTGAVQARPGKFEQADGGSLLLDEITEMPLSLQAKLLRVLQEREVEPLGASRSRPVDGRVLATSNRDLREAVAQGRLREDLYYRLNVFPLCIPPLRDRRADILPLARLLLKRHWRGPGGAPQLGAAACGRLCAHGWPGNVRELENVVQRALVLCDGGEIGAAAILLEDAPLALQPAGSGALGDAPDPAPDVAPDGAPGLLGRGVQQREAQLILDALHAEAGCRKDAAQRLGISPRTLRYKLAKLRAAGARLPGAARSVNGE